MSSLGDFLPAPTDGQVLNPEEETIQKSTEDGIRIVPGAQTKEAGISRIVALPTDSNGKADFTAIVRQGENASRVVHATYDAMVEKPRSEVLKPAPSQEELDETTRRTRAALEKAASRKIVAKTVGGPKKEKPTFLRYTPANTNTAHNSGSRQRIIKMVSVQQDPMEPPRFSQRKAPVNPPSPPAPVLHSPERKPTKEETATWKIPPVVSKWKNNRGYTIALDKRLAADGRGTEDHTINDRFADFAEALHKAEQDAREEVDTRARMQRQASIKAREAREKEVHVLAERARQERKGYLGLAGTDVESSIAPEDVQSIATAHIIADEAPPVAPKQRKRSRFSDFDNFALPPSSASRSTGTDEQNKAELLQMRHREAIRQERRLQREREQRMEAATRNGRQDVDGPTLKRSKLTRDADRDLSERVALGQGAGSGGGQEVMFDQRLFNQDAGGGHGASHLGAGFGSEDHYNVYDTPLFAEKTKSFLRSSGNSRRDREAATMAQRNEEVDKSSRRVEPVEFERDTDAGTKKRADAYGMDKFFTKANKPEK